MADFTPYSTAKSYFGALPQWASSDDAERIASYQLYEEMYWGANIEGISVEDGEPVAIPAARSLVEAIHRFLAVDWGVAITGAQGEDTSECQLAFDTLFKREQVHAKVSSAKRFGLIRGDALLHVVADVNKPAGSRISIYELDPASYFPIYDIDEPDKIVGCHLVDQITDAEDKIVIRRQTYRKQVDDNGIPTGLITTETALYETAGWDDRFGAKPEDIKQILIEVPETPLPPQITALPVYHWKNQRNPADPFGSSALRGLEKLFKSIDQTITDQDLALALASLGVYATDSGAPTDEEGNETSWVIGPGRVVEHAVGSKFVRVNGVTSVDPSIKHADYLESKARQGAGVPSVAMGEVEVSSAESGIALYLRFMPLLSANKERELEMLSVLDHLLFDLKTMWFPAYESLNFSETIVVKSRVGNPLPQNREAIITETLKLLSVGIITLEMATAKLAELGWVYPADAVNKLLEEMRQKADASDPFAARGGSELDQ